MARSMDLSNLSRDECRVILAMLTWMSQREVVYGANVEDLDLPPTWRRSDCRKVRLLCEQLVRRGIFLRQYGDDYHYYNYRGSVKDQAEVWYSFNETLFIWGGEVRSAKHFTALTSRLAPYLTARAAFKLLVAALETLALFIDSDSIKQSERRIREMRREKREKKSAGAER